MAKGGKLASKVVTDTAIELVTATVDATPERLAEAIVQLRAMPNLHRGPIARTEGSIPSQPRCEELVSMAWKYMRSLGDCWPVEPAEVPDAKAARRCLDQVVAWCTGTHADDRAPTLPERLQGDLTKLQMNILNALWDAGSMTVDRLCEAAWSNTVSDEAVVKAVRRLSNRLLELDVQGVSLFIKNQVVVLDR